MLLAIPWNGHHRLPSPILLSRAGGCGWSLTQWQHKGVCLLLCSLLRPPFHIAFVLCPPEVSPATEDKESELWKMLHEPEEQAAGGEEAQAGVRMASQLPLG